VDLADIHGQWKFNFKHAAISRDESKHFLDLAFWRDFERNGPSLYRICRTTLEGWRRYKNHQDQRVRERFQWEVRTLRRAYSGMLWAMERQLRDSNEAVSRRVRELRHELEREFSGFSKLATGVLGPMFLWMSKREQKRLEAGQTYEPQVFIERRNWEAAV
jgi:hypothetical protein